MIKKLLYLFTIILLFGCGSSNKYVYTSKKKPTTTKRTVNTTKKSTIPVRNAAPKRATETMISTSKTTVYTNIVFAYVDDFKHIAKNNMKEYGIPASITLAQGILESGAGRGDLAMRSNNHFGIKCHTGWTGEKVYHDDDAEQECFRKYEHPSESYRDHSLFLTSRPRYSNLFKLDKGDYESWAKGLKSAGYATDVKYPDKLIGLIERFELYKYDNEVLSRDFKPSKKEVILAQGGDYYTIQQGDTLYSLSKKFNLKVDDLKKLNNMSDNAISIGQQIKIK